MQQQTDNSECKALVVRKTLSYKQSLLLYFYTYSFLGWVLETIYAFCVLGGFTKRGFLFLPVCPIYGFGAIIMLLFISKYKDNSIKNFFASAIIFSAFEYLAGFALDALFKIRLWDYTNDFFNINGRISILYTLFWGVTGLVFINQIHPFVEKLVRKFLNKFNPLFHTKILTIITIIFISDVVLSCIRYLNLM